MYHASRIEVRTQQICTRVLARGFQITYVRGTHCTYVLHTVLQVLIVQYGGDIFSTKPLSVQQWAACTGIGAITLLVRAVLRLLPPHPTGKTVPESQ